MPYHLWHIFSLNSMMKNLVLVTGLALLFSCSSGENKNRDNDSPGEAVDNEKVKLSPTAGCYRMVIERDTAEMKLNVAGDSVSGDLFYNPYQTDSNFGTFKGTFKDSTLRAWYTFESEGMVSYREVVYKLTPDGFVEGYGDIEISGDSAWFKYPQTLKFEDEHPFKKIQCN